MNQDAIPSYLTELLKASFALTTKMGQTVITTEHIVHSILSESDVKTFLSNHGVNTRALVNEIETYLRGMTHVLSNNILSDNDPNVKRIQVTNAVNNLFTAAKGLSSLSGRDIDAADMLAAIFIDTNSYASYFLRKHGITEKMIEELAMDVEDSSVASGALAEHCTNLNEKVKTESDPLIGRDNEIMSIAHTLGKRKKCNVLLVGEPGVGKTMIAEGLAQKINSGDVPKTLRDKIIYSLDVGSVLAGCKFRGDFEEKIKEILEELVENKNAILFIDEAHQMDAGEGKGNSGLGFSSMLKPELSRGRVKVIASTTYEGLRKTFEKDSALMRRFNVVNVDEPTTAQAIQILKGLRSGMEVFHKCEITDTAVEAAVELTVRYQADKNLPDKAIDILDSACARKNVHDSDSRVVNRESIILEVSEATGINIKDENHNEEDVSRILGIADELKSAVFHQENAIDTVSESIIISKSGLKDPNRPIGSYVFVGPSGCGKTYLAKRIANYMNMNMLKYDMSEFQEKHSVARLIGAPPGYVGFGDGSTGEGQLVNDILKNPNSVILLDEVEKAHPDVFTILLQLLDEGRITGTTGKVADARNCIVIMCSNLGTAESSKNNLGFNSEKSGKSATSKAVEGFFLTELRGRITATIEFNKLDDLSYRKIVVERISELSGLIHNRNIKIIPSEQLIDHILELNKNSQYGAREIAKIVGKTIKYPLSVELLKGTIANNSSVTLDWRNDKLVITPNIVTMEFPVHAENLI